MGALSKLTGNFRILYAKPVMRLVSASVTRLYSVDPNLSISYHFPNTKYFFEWLKMFVFCWYYVSPICLNFYHLLVCLFVFFFIKSYQISALNVLILETRHFCQVTNCITPSLWKVSKYLHSNRQQGLLQALCNNNIEA